MKKNKDKESRDGLRKQLYILYAVILAVSIILGLFFYGSLFDYLSLLLIIVILIQNVRLIANKDYLFGIISMIPMLFSLVQFIDRRIYYNLIYWADTAELINILYGLSIIVFAIASFIYSIQLIKRKEHRWGISLLIISLLVIIYLGLTLLLSIIFQGLK